MRHKFSTLVIISYLTVVIGAGASCVQLDGAQTYDLSNMPTTKPEPTLPVYPVELILPTAGDAVGSTSGAAPAQPPWIKLQSGVAGARQQSFGGGIRRHVSCYASNAITIDPLGGVAVYVSSAWATLLDTTGAVFDPTNGGAVTLGISTRYWLYVTITAGALVYSISTTAPDSGRKYMTSDESQLYVSTFITNPDRSVVPYVQSEGRFDYYDTENHPSLKVLNNGAATLTATVTIGLPLPTQSHNASMRFSIGNDTGHAAVIYDFAGTVLATLADNGVIANYVNFHTALDTAHKFQYNVSNATYVIQGYVTGFNL